MGTLPLDQGDSTASLLANTPVIWGHLLALRVSESPSSIIYIDQRWGMRVMGLSGSFSFLHLPGQGGMLRLQETPLVLVTCACASPAWVIITLLCFWAKGASKACSKPP